MTTGTSYEYITIKEAGPLPGKKTNRWTVHSKHGDFLGAIMWFGRWRQYTFSPEKQTVFSAGCLDDIRSFITEEMSKRK